MMIEPEWGITIFYHDGRLDVWRFDSRGEAEVFLWMLPLLQVEGYHLDVAGAIITPPDRPLIL